MWHTGYNNQKKIHSKKLPSAFTTALIRNLAHASFKVSLGRAPNTSLILLISWTGSVGLQSEELDGITIREVRGPDIGAGEGKK